MAQLRGRFSFARRYNAVHTGLCGRLKEGVIPLRSFTVVQGFSCWFQTLLSHVRRPLPSVFGLCRRCVLYLTCYNRSSVC